MLDPFAINPLWTLLIGLPIIALLTAMAVRRARAVAARIREVREEMARNPQDPYSQLASLLVEKSEGKPNKRVGGRNG